MAFLFWLIIQEAKRLGVDEFDLGRSDIEDHGLIDFKDHLGAVRKPLQYIIAIHAGRQVMFPLSGLWFFLPCAPECQVPSSGPQEPFYIVILG